MNREPFLSRIIGQRLDPSRRHTILTYFHSRRPSDRHISDARLPLPGYRSSLPLSSALTTLPPWPAHPHRPHLTNHSPRLSGGHPPFRPAHAMGRLDSLSGYHPHRRIQRSHLRNATDSRIKKSPTEAYSRKRGYEWTELLSESRSESFDG